MKFTITIESDNPDTIKTLLYLAPILDDIDYLKNENIDNVASAIRFLFDQTGFLDKENDLDWLLDISQESINNHEFFSMLNKATQEWRKQKALERQKN
jgi:hypothetical protein